MRSGIGVRHKSILIITLDILLVGGLASVAIADVPPEFQITISPPTQTVEAGKSASFAVGVGAVGGFSSAVVLTVASDGPGGAFPPGVTAAFDVDSLVPPGTSILTLTAANNVPNGTSFSVIVTGTAAGFPPHTATGQATVDFGLPPVCYGAIEGFVTDADTGAPIVGADVSSTPTDVAGHYRFEVALDDGNLPKQIAVGASKEPTYWSESEFPVEVRCKETTLLDFALVRVRPAELSGRVVEGFVVPPDYSTVIPTSTPIEGAIVYLPNHATSAGLQTTAADGSYDLGSFRVGHNNEPIDLSVHADKFRGAPDRDGYYSNDVGFHAEADDVLVQQIALVKQCTGSVSGHVTTHAGQPAPGVRVDVFVRDWDGDSAITDAQGAFSIPRLLLGHNTAPITYTAAADFPFGTTAPAPLTTCGDHAEVELALAPPDLFGDIEGRVLDQETLQPVEGARVGLPGGGPGGSFIVCPCDDTDADGHYLLEHVFLGTDVPPGGVQSAVTAGKDDYWSPLSPVAVTVRANETSTADDILILRRHYASMTGIVRDAITKQPIPDASISVVDGPFSGRNDATDADGRYSVDMVQLGFRNAPQDVFVGVTATGYWPVNTTVGVRADETSTLDFELLPVCQDATISGTVVNAETQEPIEGAFVTGAGFGVLTDANGQYRIEHVSVGTDNSPVEVRLTASATGFHQRSKTITIFCGAAIQVDFGRTHVPAEIEGYVTDITNGSPGTPMADVFIGSGFGGSDYTDENGHYLLTEAPVNPDGSPRFWLVTAIPAGFVKKTDGVTVRAGETARLDFTFGEPSQGSGSLRIMKTLDPGGATTGLPSSYGVHYDCGSGHTGDVTVVAGGGAVLADGSVPFGRSCTVSEPNLPTAPAGYSFGSPTFSPSAMVTIDQGSSAVTVTTHNTLTRDTGSLELAKHLSGGPAGYTGPFTIHWDCGAFGSGDATVSTTTSAIISQIPTGTQCTASETPPSAPTGYTFGTPTFSPSATVTIATKGATVTLTTNNTLTSDTGTTCSGLTPTITGTPGDDVIDGTYGPDVIDAGAGNDVINGLSDDDVICGGEGDDSIDGGRGDDLISGGAGDDVIHTRMGDDSASGDDGADLLFGESGNDALDGGAGDDVLTGAAGNDVLRGGDGNDQLRGGAGDDELHGDAGNDQLRSSAGNDQLYGDAGDDILAGGADIDYLDGGTGKDLENAGNEPGETCVSGSGDGDRLIGCDVVVPGVAPLPVRRARAARS